jgi:molybdate transport system substrate-binding protein
MNVQPLTLMSTLAVFAPLKGRIAHMFESEAGVSLNVRFDPTTVLLDALEKGDDADAIIATEVAIDALIAKGILLTAGRVNIARTAVGIAKRLGARPLDISSPAKCVDVLRNAKSIAYSKTGASGIFFDDLIERLGIADEVRSKAIIIPKGFTAELLVSGEAELAIQQMSELAAIPGVDLVGALPEPYSSYTTFSAAVFKASKRQGQARLFTNYLTNARSVSALSDAGLEPIGVAS